MPNSRTNWASGDRRGRQISSILSRTPIFADFCVLALTTPGPSCKNAGISKEINGQNNHEDGVLCSRLGGLYWETAHLFICHAALLNKKFFSSKPQI
jgi:hypothetical protein